MKFVIETEKSNRETNLNNILDKMYSIEDNIVEVLKTLKKQYPSDTFLVQYNSWGFDRIAGVLENITVDTNIANDEFYLQFGEDIDNSICIEVVSEEVAESNDKDYVNTNNGFSKEEVGTYTLGGKLSQYSKLGSSEYYFKFM